MHRREGDIPINVCKEKRLTNMRSSTADVTRRLNATVRMSLDEALDFIVADELVEVTPQNFRMRKKELSTAGRSRHRAAAARERAN
jgi:GTP-binding protein